MQSDRIKISARGLLELLAGKITLEKYHADHPWGDGQMGNMFELVQREGRSISLAQIEPMEYPDDDWIVFEFGEPDPAASPFIIPDQPKSGQ